MGPAVNEKPRVVCASHYAWGFSTVNYVDDYDPDALAVGDEAVIGVTAFRVVGEENWNGRTVLILSETGRVLDRSELRDVFDRCQLHKRPEPS